MTKIAINGFGRIGRLFFRQAFGMKGFDIVAINDLGNVENLAYLLKYDSTYRQYNKEVSFELDSSGIGGFLIVDGKKIKFIQEKEATKLPWKDLDIDIVVESTGIFESFEKNKVHIQAGAKRVVLTAPAKDDDTDNFKTVLMGLNSPELKTCSISSNASCTTNGVASVIAVLHEAIGIKKAFLNTTHGYTATQNLVDGPVRGGSDFRRGRAAAQNISPSSTGATIAVERAMPELKGKFGGVAMRVPIITGSLAHLAIVMNRATTIEEVNKALSDAAKSKRWQGILMTTNDQIVSSDIIGLQAGALVDLGFTKIVDGDFVNIFSWYDNEWGYVTTLVKHVLETARYL